MAVSTEAEVAALVLTVLVHLIGAGVLVWGMLSPEDRRSWRRHIWGDDDGGGPPRWPEPEPDDPSGGGDGVDLLDDSAPARVRLREPGRLADAHPRPPRRPVHPEREPQRTPVEHD